MVWESTKVTLMCGCEGVGFWDETWPEDGAVCQTHGPTVVRRISRIREATPSRNFQLGVAEPEAQEVPIADGHTAPPGGGEVHR